jgi:hypothetical protein
MNKRWIAPLCSLAVTLGACGDDDSFGGSNDGSATLSAGTTSTDDDTTRGSTSDATDSQGSATSSATSSEDSGSTSTGSGSTGSDEDSGSTGSDEDSDSTGSDEDSGSSDEDTGDQSNDQDGDGIPDDADPFPNDPDLPGTATPNLIYAHSAGTLWTMEVAEPYALAQVSSFSYQSNPGQMTDIAIDRWGVLYGVTFNDLFVCHPQQAVCYRLAGLPQSFNGLTMIPAGFIEPNKEVLVAIANDGSWHRVDLVGPQMAELTQIGSYGGGYTSSGDAFSIVGVGTFGAVNGSPHDIIVEVDPSNGNVISEVATVTGYSNIYGLAGWDGSIFAFDSTGAVVRIDPNNGDVEVIHASTGVAWWGAGVVTILPQ